MSEPIKKGDLVYITAQPRPWRVATVWLDYADAEPIARIEAIDPQSVEYAVIRAADLRKIEPPPEGS
jgi:hypothetical protein